MFVFGDFFGGKNSKITKKISKKMYQRLQFLTDFARICFKRCVSTMRKTWLGRIFDFLFWGFFKGKKLEKSLEKTSIFEIMI